MRTLPGISKRCINEILPHYYEIIKNTPSASNSEISDSLNGSVNSKFNKAYSRDTIRRAVTEISNMFNQKPKVDNSHILEEIKGEAIKNINAKYDTLKHTVDFDSDFEFPESEHNPQRFFEISTPRDGYKIGLLYDIHIPYHHATHLKIAVKHMKEWGADEILLMGDVVDFAGLSKYEKNWRQRDIDLDIDLAQTFIENLQKFMPNVKITWKEGNHEKRVETYKNTVATAYQKVKSMMFKELLQLDKFGVSHLDSFTIIRAGKLHIMHGHELPGGGENVARNKMKRAMANIIFGHSHLSQEHVVKSIDGSYFGSWGVGSLCQESPDWNPYNQWINGFACVTINSNGNFTVENKKIINGEIR